jgi:hypothetical protein
MKAKLLLLPVVVVIVGSFVAQMLMGFCPVP